MVGISVCIIGKNEEENLDRCLKSIQNIADEIIYLDTGSKDKSIEIAKKYKATVYIEKFDNNFSNVRNTCKSYAKNEWILFIDCDEEMKNINKKDLTKLLEVTKAEAFFVTLINMIDNKENDKFESIRLFRNKKEYIYEGKIHEQIGRSIARISGVDSILYSEIEILHYGYEQLNIKKNNKHKRNIKILNSIEECDRDGFYYYNLANEYASQLNNEKSIKFYEKALNLNKPKDIYDFYLYQRLANCYYSVGKFEKAIDTANRGIESCKDNLFLIYLKSLCYAEQMKFTKSLECMLSLKKELSKTENKKKLNNYGLGICSESQIDEYIKELKECSINKYEGMLTTVLDYRKCEYINLEAIKSVNEISDNIIVIIDKFNLKNKRKKKLSDIIDYVEIIENNDNKIYEILKKLSPDIKTEYIFYLKSNEGLSFEDEVDISEYLTKLKANFAYTNISKDKSCKVRVVKKDYIKLIDKSFSGYNSHFNISYFE